jgi:hypothetical protein
MGARRRDFFKACLVLVLPGITNDAGRWTADDLRSASIDPEIGNSIKAAFGDGFSILSCARSGTLVQADIEHCGNRYAIASEDSLDWRIIRSSLGHQGPRQESNHLMA